jgi:zinc/manganese transport system substrate-binding protein
MKSRRFAAICVLLILVGGIGGIIIHNNTLKSTSSGLQVVAAENFWGNIAEQLGGSHVHVTSFITNPNADPHFYESNANDAAEVSSANIVIVNGVGYDDFMSKLLGGLSHTGQQVLTAQQILGVANGSNPHLWYNIPKVHLVAAQITGAYIKQDPAHKTDYERNLIAFDQSLQPLLQTINNIKQQYGGTPVAYTEPVPGYMLAAADLSVDTPEGFAKSVEDGIDPSPADTNTMDALITNKTVKVLLYNAQTISPVTEHVKALARESNIPVIGVTETLPGNEKSYQSWQANQLRELQNDLAETK